MQKPDLSLFPQTPGVYLYKDSQGRVLYVGKARNLRQRLASYFRAPETLPIKTALMLDQAHSLDILNTATEKEALLLEASLIKKHRPKYNILLRDDKEYLLFFIGNEHPYPRVEIVRHTSQKRKHGKGLFFGPYSSGTAARETWKLIHKYFPLRRCRDTSFKNRTRPCLYHHMGQCLAPCTLSVPQATYQNILRKVRMILSGRSRELVKKLQSEMQAASEQLHFEEAARLRDQITALQQTIERQSVVLAPGTDLDLIGVAETDEGLALGVVFVRDGLLLEGRNFFWPALTVEETPELLSSFLAQFYVSGNASVPPRIVVPWLPGQSASDLSGKKIPEKKQTSLPPTDMSMLPEQQWKEIQAEELAASLHNIQEALADRRAGSCLLCTPRSPDEDRLVFLAAANAKEAAKSHKQDDMSRLLQVCLHAPHPIQRIEAVDISHTGGRQTRAGLVVFSPQGPLSDQFRTYALDQDLAVRQAEAGDDYAALSAWAERRIQSGPPWPDLLLIDGGKGQLQSVLRVFQQHEPASRVVIASIAKARTETGRADRRAGNIDDRIFIPGRSNPLNLRPGGPELLFLQRVRDCVHDFSLGRHRQARAAATFSGELARLPGIGAKLTKSLFDTFGSLANMAVATEEELRQTPGVGRAKAAMLKERLAHLVGPAKNAAERQID